jgi:hypothetical protein
MTEAPMAPSLDAATGPGKFTASVRTRTPPSGNRAPSCSAAPTTTRRGTLPRPVDDQRREAVGRLLHKKLCASLRQQYLHSRSPLSETKDPTSVYCSPDTGATRLINLLNRLTKRIRCSEVLSPTPHSLSTEVPKNRRRPVLRREMIS